MNPQWHRCPHCQLCFAAKPGEPAPRTCPGCGQALAFQQAKEGAGWYIAQGKAKSGPCTLAELQAMADTGSLLPATMLLRPGGTRWEPASASAELRFAMPAQAQPTSAPLPSTASARKGWRDYVADISLRTDATPHGRFLMRLEDVLFKVLVIYFTIGFLLSMIAVQRSVRPGGGQEAAADREFGDQLSRVYQTVFEPANRPFRLVLPGGGRFRLFEVNGRHIYLDLAPLVAAVVVGALVVIGFFLIRKALKADVRPATLQGRPGLRLDAIVSETRLAAASGQLAGLLGAAMPDFLADPKDAALDVYRLALAHYVVGNALQAKDLASQLRQLVMRGYGPAHFNLTHALELLGHCAMDAGDVAAARTSYQEAASIRARMGLNGELSPAVSVLDAFARAELQAGRGQSAVGAFTHGCRLVSACGTQEQHRQLLAEYTALLQKHGLPMPT